MIAGVYREDMAVATGSECDRQPVLRAFELRCITAVTYLFRTTGQVLGVSLSGAVLQTVLLRTLRRRITGPGSLEVRRYVNHLYIYMTSLYPDHRGDKV